MDVLNLIKKRRSTRKYKFKQISHSLVNRILEAGRWAPSGLNNQPWRFRVISDSQGKNDLSEFTKYGYILRKASVLILVFLDTNNSYHRDKDIMAIGACIQNMLLEAHGLGIGSCWLGEILQQKKAVNSYLKLPNSIELMAVVTLGYSAEKLKIGRRKQLKKLLL